MPGMFVSYRRADASAEALLIADRLRERFGPESIFVDVEQIGIGQFPDKIKARLSDCDLFIAVIGAAWNQPENGTRRLDQAKDWVRQELETAISRSVPIVPILIDGIDMPPADSLPPSVRNLRTHNAFELRHSSRFDDLNRLVREIERHLGYPSVRQAAIINWTKPDRRTRKWTGLFIGDTGAAISAAETSFRDGSARPAAPSAGMLRAEWGGGINWDLNGKIVDFTFRAQQLRPLECGIEIVGRTRNLFFFGQEQYVEKAFRAVVQGLSRDARFREISH